jgi:DNA-binding transcriptional ArsR family regulator
METITDTIAQEEMLAFFKALANEERLKIAGLLGVQPRSVAELSEMLKLKPAVVTRHLLYLSEMHLVRNLAGLYRLDGEALQALSKRVLEGSLPRPNPDDFEGEAYDRKVLADFFTPEGRLRAMPMQEKKLLAVLRHVVQVFQPGERYPEKEVNELLRRFNPDTAALRRYLVDYRMMDRKDGVYWKL